MQKESMKETENKKEQRKTRKYLRAGVMWRKNNLTLAVGRKKPYRKKPIKLQSQMKEIQTVNDNLLHHKFSEPSNEDSISQIRVRHEIALD